MSVHGSTSLSIGINSHKTINSNTWVLSFQVTDATTEIVSRKNSASKKEFPENEIKTKKKHISIHIRRTLESYIEPILMYGCEAWTISKEVQKKTGGNRNVVPSENTMNLMVRKEIKQNRS